MRSRVLHLITGLLGGGAEALLHDLVATDRDGPFEHIVVSMLDAGTFGPRIAACGVPLLTLDMRHGRPTLDGMKRFRRICNDLRPAVVQGWMYHANLLSLLAPRRRGIAVVWSLHAADINVADYRLLTRLVRRTGAVLSRCPDAIVVNSPVTQSDHERLGYRPRRWIMIPNGFDVSRFRPDPDARASIRQELRLSDSTPLIGLIARFDPMKDHATFLDAAKLAVDRHVRAHFVLAGQGTSPENSDLMSMIAQRGLEARVHVLGFRADIPRITAA